MGAGVEMGVDVSKAAEFACPGARVVSAVGTPGGGGWKG